MNPDQPVTPDREAAVLAVARRRFARYGYGELSSYVADAAYEADDWWPLLIEALDRARQQGRDEMTREVVGWLSVGGVDLVATRLARGADRKADDDG